MQKGRGTVRKRSDGVWSLRLPKGMCEDTHFPFEPGESVRVSFSENGITAEKFEQQMTCKFCLVNESAKLVRTNTDGTGHYRCEKCGEEFDD